MTNPVLKNKNDGVIIYMYYIAQKDNNLLWQPYPERKILEWVDFGYGKD